MLVAAVLAGCTDEVATFESCGDSCQPGDFKALWFFETNRAIELAPNGEIAQGTWQGLTFSDLQLENPRDVPVPSLGPNEHVGSFRIGPGGDIALFGVESHADYSSTFRLHALDASANERWVTDMPVGIVAPPTPQQFFLSSSVDKQSSLAALGASNGMTEWTITAQRDLGYSGTFGAVLPDGGLAATMLFTGPLTVGTSQLIGREIYSSAVVMALAPDGSPRWTALFQTTNGDSPLVAALAAGPRGEVAVLYRAHAIDTAVGRTVLPQIDKYGIGGVALLAPDGSLRFAVPLEDLTSTTSVVTDGQTVYVGTGDFDRPNDCEIRAIRDTGIVWTQTITGPGKQSVQLRGLTANGLLVTAGNTFSPSDTIRDNAPRATFEIAGVTSRAPQAMFYLEP